MWGVVLPITWLWLSGYANIPSLNQRAAWWEFHICFIHAKKCFPFQYSFNTDIPIHPTGANPIHKIHSTYDFWRKFFVSLSCWPPAVLLPDDNHHSTFLPAPPQLVPTLHLQGRRKTAKIQNSYSASPKVYMFNKLVLIKLKRAKARILLLVWCASNHISTNNSETTTAWEREMQLSKRTWLILKWKYLNH